MRGNGSKDAGDMATSETGSARMETGSERKAAQRRRAARFLEAIAEGDLAAAGNVNVVVAAEALSNIPPHSSAEEPGRVRTADGWRNAGLGWMRGRSDGGAAHCTRPLHSSSPPFFVDHCSPLRPLHPSAIHRLPPSHATRALQ